MKILNNEGKIIYADGFNKNGEFESFGNYQEAILHTNKTIEKNLKFYLELLNK